jgi:hypothetical protein
MELWQALLVGFGGNATLLLVIAFLGRSLTSNVLTKDVEKFKNGLSRDVEKFKGDLQVAAKEHEIRFSKLHEKRAEVLAELYKLLVVATWETGSFASPIEWTGEPDKRQKYQTALNAIAEYFRFFDQHRIYFPQELCVSLEAFAHKLRSPSVGFGVYLKFEYPNARTEGEKSKAWIAAWDSVEKDIPPLRSAIELEFRKLLGAISIRTT